MTYTIEIRNGSRWLQTSTHKNENEARSIASEYASKHGREARVLDEAGTVISVRKPKAQKVAA